LDFQKYNIKEKKKKEKKIKVTKIIKKKKYMVCFKKSLFLKN